MINETQLIVKKGGSSLTEYTINFETCPDTSAIVCAANKIGVDNVSPLLPVEIWQQVADENITLDFYDGSDVYLASLTINSFNGVDIIYFDASASCALVEGIACYFKFSIITSNEKDYYLDLYPLESISQNWAFQDVGNFQALGDFTRDFRIPASDRNITGFGFLDDSNYLDSENIYAPKVPAEIRVDKVPLGRGHLRVMQTLRPNDLPNEMLCNFLG